MEVEKDVQLTQAKSDEEGMGIIKDQPGQRLVSPILSLFSACVS